MDENAWASVLISLGGAVLLLASIRRAGGTFGDLGRDLLTLRSLPGWALIVGVPYLLMLTFGLALAVSGDGGVVAWLLLGVLAVMDAIFLRATVERLANRMSRGSGR